MVDYLEGANHCEVNSDRLQISARIILKDEDGTDYFALFLYYIAYEEIAKGVFCLFVHKGYVSDEFVESVFEQHHPKIALFEEILRSFGFREGSVFLGGRRLGEIPLSDFIRSHIDKIRQHRETTMDFLYVDNTDPWKVPLVEISDIENQEKQIRHKINALNIIFNFVKNEVDKIDNQADNFQFYEDENGGFTMQFDQT